MKQETEQTEGAGLSQLLFISRLATEKVCSSRIPPVYRKIGQNLQGSQMWKRFCHNFCKQLILDTKQIQVTREGVSSLKADNFWRHIRSLCLCMEMAWCWMSNSRKLPTTGNILCTAPSPPSFIYLLISFFLSDDFLLQTKLQTTNAVTCTWFTALPFELKLIKLWKLYRRTLLQHCGTGWVHLNALFETFTWEDAVDM